MPRKRLGKETQQERNSRRQFKEFVEGYGWVAYEEDPDLGEDFLIKIFRDQVPSGISFQIQLKSTKDINSLRMKDGRISYRLDVDDLEHWDVEWPPVMLVIWDISSKNGWYIFAEQAIKNLDENRPNWRNQKTTTIYILYTNALDNKHLSQIDQNLTQKIAPIILKGKDLKFNVEFSFPKDKESQEKLQELQQFHRSGEPVELDDRYIKRLEIPDALKRLYGKSGKPAHIHIGPTGPQKMFTAQIEFSAPGVGIERLDYVEFYLLKGGQEEYTLSNKKQKIPYKIDLIVNRINHTQNFTLTINYSKLDAIEAYKALKIQRILSSRGTLTYRLLDRNLKSKLSFGGAQWPSPPEEFPEFIEFIYKIQTMTGEVLKLREGGKFSYEDYENAREMVSILETGTYKRSGLTANFGVGKASVKQILDVRSNIETLELKTIYEESFLDILDTHFSLGPMVEYIKGHWDMPFEEVQHWLEAAEENEKLMITLRDVDLFEEFADWPKHVNSRN